MYDNLDYRAIQRRADAQLKPRKVRIHIALFAVNLLLFLAFFLSGWANIGGRGLYPEQFFVSMLFLSVGWFTGLVLHGASTWMVVRGERNLREQAVAREIAREMERLGLDEIDSPLWTEKSKRGSRLSDNDGELQDVVDDGQDRRSFLNQE
jgi:hypothetical protein